MKVDKRNFRIQENSKFWEISNKKYILHKGLEFYNKKRIQPNKNGHLHKRNLEILHKEIIQGKTRESSEKKTSNQRCWGFITMKLIVTMFKSFLTRKLNNQQKKILNKEFKSGQAQELSYKKVIHTKRNMEILYKEIVQDRIREFFDK